MPVRKRNVPMGEIQKSKGGSRFVADINTPIRCKACSRLMDPTFSIEGKCPNCNTEFTKKEWARMAAESLQVKSQGGWDRDTLERFEDEQTGNNAYIAPDGTTREQNEVARRMANWAIQEKRRAEKLKKVRTWGGSGISNLLCTNPYK